VRIQYLEPVILLQRPQDVQRVFFVRELLDLVPDGLVADVNA
jgi:hypothetical protein